ncbi:MAG: hypothetical protein ABI885_02570 [Gammaproteobacteria bacterium]
MAHDVTTMSVSPVTAALASTVVEMGGGNECYASPKVVVSALLEALWSVYSNADAVGGASGSMQAELVSPRA